MNDEHLVDAGLVVVYADDVDSWKRCDFSAISAPLQVNSAAS